MQCDSVVPNAEPGGAMCPPRLSKLVEGQQRFAHCSALSCLYWRQKEACDYPNAAATETRFSAGPFCHELNTPSEDRQATF